MSSRRDAVQAYSFSTRRLRSGMLHGEPDGSDPTSTRTWRGVVGGIVLALVIGVGVGVFAFVSPGGNDSWRQRGTLVLVENSGARYLYLDTLHPVLNQTSARLLAGSALRVVTVSSASIRGAAQGAPIGLVGAPDSVPDAAALGAGSWLACSVVQTDSRGATTTQLALRVGAPDALGTGLTATQAVWVQTAPGQQYLVWAGRRMRFDVKGGAPAALGYGAQTPVTVPVGFVDALPAGPDLQAAVPAGVGAKGAPIAGHARRVGQLFADASGQHYVLTTAGLKPVTATQTALLRGNPVVQARAYAGATPTVVAIGPKDVPAAGSGAVAASELPADPPTLLDVPTGHSLCSATRADGGTLTTTVTSVPTDQAMAGALAPPRQPGVQPGCEGADLVAVAPGSGALVDVRTGVGGSAADYLVADNGVKYPLPAAAASALGYDTGSAEPLPSALLRLLPTGPSLDPTALAASGIVAAPTSDACGG